MTSPQARKGRRAELAVAAYLSEYWPDAEPTRRSGWTDDRGDIDGIPFVVVEVKDHREHRLSAWLAEMELEVEQARATTGVLVVKRRGHVNAADWFAVTRLSDWAQMAKDAGL